jgi:flagellar assembly protein FliH
MKPWSPPSFDSAQESEPANSAPSALDSPGFSSSAFPSVQDIENITNRAYQDGFARGLEEGINAGRIQGELIGREEGLGIGRAEGAAQAKEEVAQQELGRIEKLSAALNDLLQSLKALPESIESELIEWVYQTALRLSGKEHMDRAPLVAAVQEALMRLPRPGESLVLRVSTPDLKAWQDLLHAPDPLMNFSVLEDPEIAAGHAYVELSGTRIDVGSQARDALVRSALGLMKPQAIEPNP